MRRLHGAVVLAEFLSQTDMPAEALTSQLETSYEDRLGIAAEAIEAVGLQQIARLWRVEPEFLDFLADYRTSAEYRELKNGEGLRRRFENAGFGDFFYAPEAREWLTIKDSKFPDLAGPLAKRLAVDTHMSLLADGDFVTQQETIDAALRERGFGPPEKRS